MKVYNKLVRDKIPEIIKASGREVQIKIVKSEEKLEFIEAKLMEEVNEFKVDKNLEELADIMEVLFGLAKALGFSEDDLIKMRIDKREARGGFEDGIVLEKVY